MTGRKYCPKRLFPRILLLSTDIEIIIYFLGKKIKISITHGDYLTTYWGLTIWTPWVNKRYMVYILPNCYLIAIYRKVIMVNVIGKKIKISITHGDYLTSYWGLMIRTPWVNKKYMVWILPNCYLIAILSGSYNGKTTSHLHLAHLEDFYLRPLWKTTFIEFSLTLDHWICLQIRATDIFLVPVSDHAAKALRVLC